MIEASEPEAAWHRGASKLCCSRCGPNSVAEGAHSPDYDPMANDIAPTKPGSALTWLGWLLAIVFLAAAAVLAHKLAVARSELNAAQGSAAQTRLELDHANQMVAVLSSPQSAHIVLTETRQPTRPVGQVSWLAGKGALVFIAGGLRPLPAGKTYELWLIPASGKAPIPAGLFHPDGDSGATVVLPPIPADTPAKRFEVTIEPAHGSETPSLPIVMEGQ
jgi:anti-sigma-K factor RskA